MAPLSVRLMAKHRRIKDPDKMSWSEFDTLMYNSIFRKIEEDMKGVTMTRDEWLAKIGDALTPARFQELHEAREKERRAAIGRLLLALGEEPTT